MKRIIVFLLLPFSLMGQNTIGLPEIVNHTKQSFSGVCFSIQIRSCKALLTQTYSNNFGPQNYQKNTMYIHCIVKKKIAFSYGASYYNDICPHPNQDLGKAIGRFMVISTMFRDKTIVNTDRIHLLGTASPIEFGFYKNMPFIESIDTSSPIMAAIGEMPYTKMGLHQKPIANMNNIQSISKEFVNEDLVDFNVEMFRTINEL